MQGAQSLFYGRVFPRMHALLDTRGQGHSKHGLLGGMSDPSRTVGNPAASCPSPVCVLPAPDVCPELALAVLLGTGSHCLEVSSYAALSLKMYKSPGQRPTLSLTLLCLAVRGRQAALHCHPPHFPRTFRPARNMPDVQIPQVMREFVTRGARVIQEWEPDRGLELERSGLGWPTRAQIAVNRLPGKRRGQQDGALGRHVEGLLLHTVLGTRWQVANQVAKTRMMPWT